MAINPDLLLSQRANWAEGQPISDLMARALANPQLISLAAGFVDQQSLPAGETRQALEALFTDPVETRRALQYGTTPGYPPLREALLESTRAADGDALDNVTVDQLVLTAGSNQLLHLVVECLLDPGDIVLCASPTYLVFLGTLNNLGARSVGVASDDDGLIPEALKETLARLDAQGELERVKALYLVPYFDNPGGVTIPRQRREEIFEIVQRWSHKGRIRIIEDNAYRALRYSGDDTPSMLGLDADGDTVIVAGTFSKSYSPGIRVGWGILPRDLVTPVCNQKGNIDFGSPNFSQHLMAKVLQLGLYYPHIEMLRRTYREKLAAMLAAADELLSPLPDVHWRRPRGGLYVWLHVPPHVDTGPSGRLFDAAIAEGMLYVPGQFCFPTEGEPAQRNAIRLSFGVQTPSGIRQGIAALARAIRDVTQ
ncbi:MAG: PLP-dependent aminotransferase family protein [Pirellulaceae bacterium]